MKKIRPANYLFITALLLFAACSNVSKEGSNRHNGEPSITIAVAANMQFAMKDLIEIFTRQTGIRCELIISSSGKLTAQIKQGAPFDVFVSADMKYPNEIHKSDLAAGPPKVYAYGKLVLWSMKDGFQPSLEGLAGDSIHHIAIANPKLAPYGVAAMEVLENYQLLDGVKDKLVFGESIAQTNQFVITKSAEMGFTAMSVVLSPELKGKGRWIAIDSDSYAPIEQGVIVVNRKDGPLEEARKFYDFLSSADAQTVLKSFGYGVENL